MKTASGARSASLQRQLEYEATRQPGGAHAVTPANGAEAIMPQASAAAVPPAATALGEMVEPARIHTPQPVNQSTLGGAAGPWFNPMSGPVNQRLNSRPDPRQGISSDGHSSGSRAGRSGTPSIKEPKNAASLPGDAEAEHGVDSVWDVSVSGGSRGSSSGVAPSTRCWLPHFDGGQLEKLLWIGGK